MSESTHRVGVVLNVGRAVHGNQRAVRVRAGDNKERIGLGKRVLAFQLRARKLNLKRLVTLDLRRAAHVTDEKHK